MCNNLCDLLAEIEIKMNKYVFFSVKSPDNKNRHTGEISVSPLDTARSYTLQNTVLREDKRVKIPKSAPK